MNTIAWAPPLDFIIPLIMVPWWLPVDLLWNAVVIAGTLAAQRLLRTLSVRRLIGYLLVTTLVGAIVDTVWESAVSTANRVPWGPTPSGAYLRAMPIVIVVLGLVNLLLAAGLLRLDWRRAAVLGGAMGLLTAPWAVVLF
ncbi:MAG: hypothetical protein H8E35_13780 [Ardenticatenia bacterium]|nr:hypothetical protein [Ardenticatenia bacterium]